jgi:hypothetical protein
MTNKFDLKKYLTEHKATQASILREGFEKTKIEERPKTEEEKEKEYDNYGDFIQGIKAVYPDITNRSLIVKDSPKFPGQKLYNFDDPFGPNRLIAIWDEKTEIGIVKPNLPEKESPYINPDKDNLPKGMYGESKEKLKAKIKEMIIAELSLTEENAPINMVANPVAENAGEVGEKDYEDYQELKKFLNTLSTTKNLNAYTDDIFNYNSEIDPNEGYDEFDAQYDEKFKLSEFFIDEAKKDEEEAPAEEAPEEEVDATLDTTATGEDFNIDTSAVDPNIKAVQDALTQAQAAAKNINDDKLTTQISNTVIMFTRDHIANTEKSVTENKDKSVKPKSNDEIYKELREKILDGKIKRKEVEKQMKDLSQKQKNSLSAIMNAEYN